MIKKNKRIKKLIILGSFLGVFVPLHPGSASDSPYSNNSPTLMKKYHIPNKHNRFYIKKKKMKGEIDIARTYIHELKKLISRGDKATESTDATSSVHAGIFLRDSDLGNNTRINQSRGKIKLNASGGGVSNSGVMVFSTNSLEDNSISNTGKNIEYNTENSGFVNGGITLLWQNFKHTMLTSTVQDDNSTSNRGFVNSGIYLGPGELPPNPTDPTDPTDPQLQASWQGSELSDQFHGYKTARAIKGGTSALEVIRKIEETWQAENNLKLSKYTLFTGIYSQEKTESISSEHFMTFRLNKSTGQVSMLQHRNCDVTNLYWLPVKKKKALFDHLSIGRISILGQPLNSTDYKNNDSIML